MSLSTVIALNERSTDFDSIACSAAAAIGASVNTKASIVAMSGAIMPAPLAMPLIDDFAVAELDAGGRDLRIGVGGHDRLGGGDQRVGSRASAISASMTRVMRVASSGSPMTPVEAMKISFGAAPIALAAASATSATAAAPTPPVKALALPELTISARALPALQMLRGTSRPAPRGTSSA